MTNEQGAIGGAVLPMVGMVSRQGSSGHRSREPHVQRSHGARKHREAHSRQIESTQRVADGRAEGAALPRNYFLQQLHREKRRADRNHSTLSMVVCRAQCTTGDTDTDFSWFLERLAGSVRETDILGRLGSDVVGIICPDTNKQGVQRLVEIIGELSRDVDFCVEAATYPDQHFEELAGEGASIPETNPLFIGQFGHPASGGYRLKRALDVVGAMTAILLLSPLFLLTAVAVKLSSPGPIIFKQSRLGRAGVPFDFYKFRSMRHDADDTIHRAYVASLIKGEHEKIVQPDASEPHFKIKADPRVTRVGRFIRRTSLDELPQFFNVLKGDLSLVGPRPPLPYEAANYRSWHLRRVLDIKPGITGIWQVEGRSRVSFDDMVRMDIRYLRGCSLGLDLRLLLKTVAVVLTGKGAT